MFGWLTGNSSAAEKAVEGAAGMLDNAFFTEQERSSASMKILELRTKFAVATQQMSISRRVITCAVTAVWVLLVLLMIAMGILFGGDAPSVKFLFKVMKEIVGVPFAIIVGFYFFSQVASKAKGKA